MFCTNCGDLLEEGAVFCTKCGQRVEQSAGTVVSGQVTKAQEQTNVYDQGTAEAADPAPGQTNAADATWASQNQTVDASYGAASWGNQPVQGTDMDLSSQKPGKSSKKWLWLIPVMALAVIAGVVLANLQVVANTMRKLVMSPQEYYVYIEEKEIQEMASGFAVSYDNSMGAYADISNQSLEYHVDVELGQLVYEAMGSSLGLADASGLSKIGLDFLLSMKEDVFFGELAGRLDDDRLISASALADFNKGLVYAQVPELSQKYISADISESTGEITAALDDYTNMVALYPEGAVLEEMLNRYMMMVVEGFETVTEQKDVVIVEAFEEKSTKLCATMTEVEMITMLQAILTEVKVDEELISMLAGFVAYADSSDVQTFKDELIASIDEYLANAETYKAEADADNQYSMSIWVNNKGEVIGREFAVRVKPQDEVDLQEVVVSYKMPQKGQEYGYQMLISGADIIIEILGKGTKEDSDMTGEFLVKFDSEETGSMDVLTFTLEHMNLDKWKQGYMDMICRIKPDADLYSKLGMGAAGVMLVGYELIYEVDTKAFETDAVLSLVNGEELIFALDVSAKVDSAKDVSAPVDSILVENDEDLLTWMASMDFDKFVENLSQSDLPPELLEIIKAYVSQLETVVYYD